MQSVIKKGGHHCFPNTLESHITIKRNLLIVLLFLTIVGCASAPPHRILNSRYINPEYEISIKIPKGWLKSTSFPDALTKNRFLSSYKPKIVFFNNETNGVIFISFKDISLNIAEYSTLTRKKFYETIVDKTKKQFRQLSMEDVSFR